MQHGFSIIEHPSDLGIEARGRTLAEAFALAAEGLMSVILDLSCVELKETREIQLTASDHEQLLVKWLSEILYVYDGQHFVPGKFSVSKLTDTLLTADICGDKFSPDKHRTNLDVKAITYHQLVVWGDAGGGYVRVFLDI